MTISKMIFKIKHIFRNRCKYLTKHNWQQTEPTERECQVAWRIGVHPLKEMHECIKCRRRGWLFPQSAHMTITQYHKRRNLLP